MVRAIMNTTPILEAVRDLHKDFVDCQTRPMTPFGVVEYVQLTGRFYGILDICKRMDIQDVRVAELMQAIGGMINEPNSIYSMLMDCAKDGPVNEEKTPGGFFLHMHQVSIVSALQLMVNNFKEVRQLLLKKKAA